MGERAKPWYVGLSEEQRRKEQRSMLRLLGPKPLTAGEVVIQAKAETQRRDSSWERSEFALDHLTYDRAHSILSRMEKRGLVERAGTPARWKVTAKGKRSRCSTRRRAEGGPSADERTT